MTFTVGNFALAFALIDDEECCIPFKGTVEVSLRGSSPPATSVAGMVISSASLSKGNPTAGVFFSHSLTRAVLAC